MLKNISTYQNDTLIYYNNVVTFKSKIIIRTSPHSQKPNNASPKTKKAQKPTATHIASHRTRRPPPPSPPGTTSLTLASHYTTISRQILYLYISHRGHPRGHFVNCTYLTPRAFEEPFFSTLRKKKPLALLISAQVQVYTCWTRARQKYKYFPAVT